MHTQNTREKYPVRSSWFAKQVSSLALTAILLAPPCATAQSFLEGGDFEAKKPLLDWTVEADRASVDINRTAGLWIPVTVTFNSDDCTKVAFYIGAYGHPSGRCRVDNIRAKGFEVRNPSLPPKTRNPTGFCEHSSEGVPCDTQIMIRQSFTSSASNCRFPDTWRLALQLLLPGFDLLLLD